jgi:hypothetical protein
MSSLLATALLVTTTAATIISSSAFQLLAVPRDPSSPISPLAALHTGAGQNRLVLLTPARPVLFYQNASTPAPTIISDTPPQNFPQTLVLSSTSSVDLTVSSLTPGLLIANGTSPAADGDIPLLTYDGAVFVACEDQTVGYLPDTYTVLNWVQEEAEAEECGVVDVVPVCGELEELPEGALGSHEFVSEVWCFADEESVEEAFGR